MKYSQKYNFNLNILHIIFQQLLLKVVSQAAHSARASKLAADLKLLEATVLLKQDKKEMAKTNSGVYF